MDLHWADLGSGDVLDGHVTGRDRTLVDCMRSLPFDEALAIVDSALRNRSIGKPELQRLAADVKGPGSAQCRRVARHADAKAANPFESVLRAIALDIPGLELRPQIVIREGSFAARPDLVDARCRLVAEADSFEWHGSRRALKRDSRRYNSLVLLGWVVLRFSWEDVMYDAPYVRECLLLAQELVNERAQPICVCDRPA
jgi:very-short-patch-repair endonuclease